MDQLKPFIFRLTDGTDEITNMGFVEMDPNDFHADAIHKAFFSDTYDLDEILWLISCYYLIIWTTDEIANEMVNGMGNEDWWYDSDSPANIDGTVGTGDSFRSEFFRSIDLYDNDLTEIVITD